MLVACVACMDPTTSAWFINGFVSVWHQASIYTGSDLYHATENISSNKRVIYQWVCFPRENMRKVFAGDIDAIYICWLSRSYKNKVIVNWNSYERLEILSVNKLYTASKLETP